MHTTISILFPPQIWCVSRKTGFLQQPLLFPTLMIRISLSTVFKIPRTKHDEPVVFRLHLALLNDGTPETSTLVSVWKDGERGRNRTFNLLIKSSCGTGNQRFSAIWPPLDSLVLTPVCCILANRDTKGNKPALGTILGTVFVARFQKCITLFVPKEGVPRLFSGARAGPTALVDRRIVQALSECGTETAAAKNLVDPRTMHLTFRQGGRITTLWLIHSIRTSAYRLAGKRVGHRRILAADQSPEPSVRPCARNYPRSKRTIRSTERLRKCSPRIWFLSPAQRKETRSPPPLKLRIASKAGCTNGSSLQISRSSS